MKQITRPESPIDTYYALKAVKNHVTEDNLWKSYVTAVKAVCTWNWQKPNDVPYHAVYVNRKGVKDGYTVASLKNEIRRSMFSAYQADMYVKTGITPDQVRNVAPSEALQVYTKKLKQQKQQRAKAFSIKTRKEARERVSIQNRHHFQQSMF